MTTWHRFEETAEDDLECARCGVVVDPLAEQTFKLLCPLPPCPSGNNPDDECQFVPGRGTICHCLYCGRPGSTDAPAPEVELDDDDLLEAEPE